MKRFSTIFIVVASAIAVQYSSITIAQTGESRKQIEARLEQRYSELLKAEDQGKVGETWQGFVEAVDSKAAGDPKTKQLISDENADRKRLYEVIAAEETKKENITAALVGERNAFRKFEKARTDHFLKARNGEWVQMKDIAALKRDGKIGETWDGYLSNVNDKDKSNPRISAVVDLDNRLRRDVYQKTARKEKKDLGEVAAAAGARNIEKIAAGEWFLPKGGQWQKKG